MLSFPYYPAIPSFQDFGIFVYKLLFKMFVKSLNAVAQMALVASVAALPQFR